MAKKKSAKKKPSAKKKASEQKTSVSLFQVRITEDEAELKTIQPWLPQAFMSNPRPTFFVAEQESDKSGNLLGAAALRILGGAEQKLGRFQIIVNPEQRRKGVGTQLMNAMLDLAREKDVQGVLAGIPVDTDSENCKFFDTLPGFEIKRTLEHFSVTTEGAWEYLQPLFRRYKERGKFPVGYKLVPLEQADRQQVLRFVLKYLGGIPDAVIQRLRSGRRGGYLPKLSQVIQTADRKPVAVLLIRRSPKGVIVDSRVVAPEVRGSWANLLLLTAFNRKLRRLGVKEAFFEGDTESHRDTLRLAQHFGGTTTSKGLLFGCDFDQEEQPAPSEEAD